MARFLKKRTAEKGLPPGTLVFVGEQKMKKPIMRLIEYDANYFTEEPIEDIKALQNRKGRSTVTWVNVDGVHEVSLIEDLGQVFSLTPMLLEDIMHTGQRPKIDEFEDYTFIVLKMLRFENKTEKIIAEQLSIVVGDRFLLTFQEQQGDVFEPVRERIRQARKRIRSSGPDFLAYSLVDIVCENYLYIVEVLGEKIDGLEEELLSDPGKEIPLQINRYKQEINFLRKHIKPVREIIYQIPKQENQIIQKKNLGYWSELQEIALQANDAIDSYRDVLADQLNLYHTTMSTKMNDIMKVLTIFAAIFIPLTFIAGIYGTNFEVLPELHYRYSYFVMLTVMGVIAIGMLIYFKKQKWF